MDLISCCRTTGRRHDVSAGARNIDYVIKLAVLLKTKRPPASKQLAHGHAIAEKSSQVRQSSAILHHGTAEAILCFLLLRAKYSIQTSQPSAESTQHRYSQLKNATRSLTNFAVGAKALNITSLHSENSVTREECLRPDSLHGPKASPNPNENAKAIFPS